MKNRSHGPRRPRAPTCAGGAPAGRLRVWGRRTPGPGAFATLGQRDMKRVLAYSTLAVLGTLVMLLGVGTEMAVKTAVVYLMAHALYKAALFMVAGNVDHETGTRDLNVLGGLRRRLHQGAGALSRIRQGARDLRRAVVIASVDSMDAGGQRDRLGRVREPLP